MEPIENRLEKLQALSNQSGLTWKYSIEYKDGMLHFCQKRGRERKEGAPMSESGMRRLINLLIVQMST